ncbi:MAG: hypothetical protein NC338_02880 [Firmicutes bacterium]|nr:hypothetical protein [Bacillota bacterium]MCM1401828.1 hypothetical protein [Bacteroides sp.]MCM1477625.1 hypothetical protein [Bacteroides sp.]
MATISLTDIIFATVRFRGRDVLRLKLEGVSSYSEIVARVLKFVKGIRGIMTIDLRNSSQGWTSRRQLMVAA